LDDTCLLLTKIGEEITQWKRILERKAHATKSEKYAHKVEAYNEVLSYIEALCHNI